MHINSAMAKEIIEDRREFDFKLKAYGEVIYYLLERVTKEDRTYAFQAMIRLGSGHLRGEQSLTWAFNGKLVCAANVGTLDRAEVKELEDRKL
jgi:hypothetical protein